MKYYKYIISVVLYKNMNDVVDMISSVRKAIHSYKIVLVNNYYDEASLREAKALAENNSCDLLETNNNGYGAGNNCAIEYASNNYKFDYIIISNPDIVIRQFDETDLLPPAIPAIYAPDIICRTGKRQNPMWTNKSNALEWALYQGIKHKFPVLEYGAILIRKVQRQLYLLRHKKHGVSKIYAAHGAFVVLSRTALQKIMIPYSSNMFLFFEEAWLANKAYLNAIDTYYCPSIIIDHKEDGSMKVTNLNTKSEARKSVIYYYEHKRMQE